MQARTLCVILHYGSESDTWNCVSTLVDDPGVDIVISDNDPMQSLQADASLRDRVRVVRTGGQAGFAEGNNIAVKACLLDAHAYVFILNNDTLVQDGALEQMRRTLSDRGIGAVGPCMRYTDRPEDIWACGGAVNKWRLNVRALKEPRVEEPFDVDYLPGAAIMCRANVWSEVKGLPERYFLGYEEAEFAAEVRRAGYRVVVDPGATILHQVGMSGQTRPMYTYNGVRNRLRFGKYLWGVHFGFVLGALATLDVVFNRKSNTFHARLIQVRLWILAVLDEIRSAPLDRRRLSEVAAMFGGQLGT